MKNKIAAVCILLILMFSLIVIMVEIAANVEAAVIYADHVHGSGRGEWVHFMIETALKYGLNQNIPIHPGWNLIGYPSFANHNRTQGLNNLVFDTDIDLIQWFDTETRTWIFMNPEDTFEPGLGYWMHSNVENTWEVPL